MIIRVFNCGLSILLGLSSTFAKADNCVSLNGTSDTSRGKEDLSDYFQVEVMRGFLAAHTQGMQELYQHTYGVQVHFQRSMLRNRFHPNQFKKPLYYGTTINYQNLGSPAAGIAVGLGFSLFIPAGETQKTRFTVGMGGGYLSKPYSLENPKNIAIGSHINGMMRLGIQRDIWPTNVSNSRSTAQINIGMTHFSNGNWSQPNLGVNMPYLSLSYRYKFEINPHESQSALGDRNRSTKQWLKIQEHSTRIKELNASIEQGLKKRILGTLITKNGVIYRTWDIIGGLRVGRRQMEIDEEANFTVGIIEMLAERQYKYDEFTTNKNLRSYSAHPHVGLTVFLDRTYQYNKPNPLPQYNFAKTTELAAIIGNRYVFGRVGVLTDVGFYLYRPSDSKRRYFQALGLSYLVNSKLILTARLKVHLSAADYIEWGMGYRF